MPIKTATCRAKFKAVNAADAGGDEGVVEALVSVFGNVDWGGDRVMPGAFKDSLDAWAAKGDPIPFVWSHQWSDPMAYVGEITSATETDAGLVVRAKLDLDRPMGEQVFHLLKTRRVTQFSFGYDAEEMAFVQEADTVGEIRELHKVNIFEAGPTLLGMNPDTALLGAASRVPDPPKAPPKPVPDPGRDDPATIILEQRAAALMAKTRHTEE